MKKLKHISKFALEGKISQKHAEEIDEMIENKLKAKRQSIIDKAELKGAGKILDMLWSNSANEKHMDKRIELELIYFFGKNWSKDMYNFIDEEKNYPNMKSIKTLKEIKSLK